MTKYIHELLVSNQEDIVEVFDCYDGRYGNIFCKGKLVAHFYKESYSDILGQYSFIKQLEKMKINIETATVLVYELETLRDYQGDFTQMDFEDAIDYDYKKFLAYFKADFDVITEAIEKAEKENANYQFITASCLRDYL